MNINNLNSSSLINSLNSYSNESVLQPEATQSLNRDSSSSSTLNRSSSSIDLEERNPISRKSPKGRFDQSLTTLCKLCELKPTPESSENISKAKKYLQKAFERFMERESTNYNPSLFLQTMRKVQDTYNSYQAQLRSDPTRRQHTDFNYLLSKYKNNPLVVAFSSSLEETHPKSSANVSELEVFHNSRDGQTTPAEGADSLRLQEKVDSSSQLEKEINKEKLKQLASKRIPELRFNQSLTTLSELCESKPAPESSKNISKAKKYLQKAFERFMEKESTNYNPSLFLQTMRKVQDTYNSYQARLKSDPTRKKHRAFNYLLRKYKDNPFIIAFSASLKSTHPESAVISKELEDITQTEDKEMASVENLASKAKATSSPPKPNKKRKQLSEPSETESSTTSSSSSKNQRSQNPAKLLSKKIPIPGKNFEKKISSQAVISIDNEEKFTSRLESLLESIQKLAKKKLDNLTDKEVIYETNKSKKDLRDRLVNILDSFSSNLNPPLFKIVTDCLGVVYDELGKIQARHGKNYESFQNVLSKHSKYPLTKEISYPGFSQTENEQASSQSAEHHPKKHKKIKRTAPKEDITGASLGLIQPEDEEMPPAVFLEAKAALPSSKPNKKRKQPAEVLELETSVASSSIPQNQAKLLLKKTPIPGKNLEDKIRSLGKTYQPVPRYSKEFRTFWKEAEGDTLNPQYKKMYEKHRELLEQGKNPIDSYLELVDSENEIFESVLIAKKRIPKGTFLGEYSGQLVLSDRRTDPNQRYLFDVVQGTNSEGEAVEFVIDGDATCNHGSFFSHKTMSNVTIELYDDADGRHVLFFANEDVKKGDLLTIDYGPKYWEALGIDPIEEYDIQKS